MKNLQEPVWCNGLMLQAEHLQLFAGYTEQTMQLMMQGLGLGFWGVLDLSFNDSAVQLGLLQVEKLCLRLPASKFVFMAPEALVTIRILIPSSAMTRTVEITSFILYPSYLCKRPCMQMTGLSPIRPRTRFPLWLGTVDCGKPGMSL